ncbi:DUF2683 family protein [Olivibacter domesticus]|uniref:DUF2683 family protein n=1 Tax=Olivibacter domesticus TaxID=407022 RepID=UPI00373FCC0F
MRATSSVTTAPYRPYCKSLAKSNLKIALKIAIPPLNRKSPYDPDFVKEILDGREDVKNAKELNWIKLKSRPGHKSD